MEPKQYLKGIVEKAKDLGEGIIEAYVATEDTDRDDEILSIKGLDTKNYLKNPVVLFAHDYSRAPIAKAEKLTKREDGLFARMKFAIAESDFAREVYNLYKGGYLNAFSIGFIPKEVDGNTYTKSEMLEFSAVPVPANPNALLTAKSKGVISEKTLTKLKSWDEEEDTAVDEDKPETKQLTLDTTTLENAVELMNTNLLALAKEVKELKRLDHAGASPHKVRVRLVKVRQRMQAQQTIAQAANRGFARLKGARSIRKVHVKLK